MDSEREKESVHSTGARGSGLDNDGIIQNICLHTRINTRDSRSESDKGTPGYLHSPLRPLQSHKYTG